MGQLQLGDNQFTFIRLKPNTKDKAGNPAAPIDAGSVVFLVDNPNLLTLEPGADGFSTKLTAVGPLGTALVSLSATAAGQSVSGTLTVEIISEAPASIEFDVDPPTEKPDPVVPAAKKKK